MFLLNENSVLNQTDIAELDPKNGFYVIKMSSSNFAGNGVWVLFFLIKIYILYIQF